MKIIPASDTSLLVVFGDTISPELHKHVLSLFRALQARCDPRIRNLHPGYCSILIDFDPLRWTHHELASLVRQLAREKSPLGRGAINWVTVPVCYGGEFGPDMAAVAGHLGVSTDEVIRLHSSGTYLVYFLGFSPGFAYMGGLPPELHLPRLTTPRTFVAGGSVGIAGGQTGIYPVDSPGGWQIIGRTPVRMFDPEADPPSRLQPGDRLKFSRIDANKFEEMANLET